MTDNPLAEVRAALEYISENIFDEVNIRFVSETERQIKRALTALSRIEQAAPPKTVADLERAILAAPPPPAAEPEQ